MAFKKDITILEDIPVSSAHIRILAATIDYEAKRVKFTLGCWKSRAAYIAGKKQLPLEIMVEMSPAIENPLGIPFPATQKNLFPILDLDYSAESEVGSKDQQYQLIKSRVSFFADAVTTND
jgi:hypothetical protein